MCWYIVGWIDVSVCMCWHIIGWSDVSVSMCWHIVGWSDVSVSMSVSCAFVSTASRAEGSPWQPVSGEGGNWQCGARERVSSDRRK